jgi:hypothetical protein
MLFVPVQLRIIMRTIILAASAVRASRPAAGTAIRLAILLLLLLTVAMLLPARAQVQGGISSSSQFDSNPNRISSLAPSAKDAGDLLGTQSLWIGYDLSPSTDLTISASYNLGLTLWSNRSEQNFLQHDLSLFLEYDNLYLLARPTATPAADSAGIALKLMLAGVDPGKDRLVSLMYDIAGDLYDAELDTTGRTVSADSLKIDSSGSDIDDDDDEDDWWLEEDTSATAQDDEASAIDSLRYDLIEQMLTDDDTMLDDEALDDDMPDDSLTTGLSRTAPRSATAITADSLKSSLAEALLTAADSLDMDDGTPDMIESTSSRVRRLQELLHTAFPSETFVSGIDSRLDSLLAGLSAYTTPQVDTGDTDDEDIDAALLFAPVSLAYQPLIRNTSRSYGFTTIPSDAGANRLQISGGYTTGSYMSNDTLLARYESNYLYGTMLLDQKLGAKFDLWGKLSISDESYPDGALFDNTQTSIAAQLRYQPSPSLSIVLDAGYALKNYREDLSTAASSRPPRGGLDNGIAIDSAASTSLFDLGFGIFFRPSATTLVGAVVAHQSTPALHPRLLVTTAPLRGDRVVTSSTSNITDDIFSWNGNDIQLLAMQQLPWELVATAFYDHNTRDYGRVTATVNGNARKLQNRTDTRRTFELSIARDFYFGSATSHYLSAGIALGTVRNASTNFARQSLLGSDYDFNFTENYLALRLQWAVY